MTSEPVFPYKWFLPFCYKEFGIHKCIVWCLYSYFTVRCCSAKCGIATLMLCVHPSVCNVEVPWSYRLGYREYLCFQKLVTWIISLRSLLFRLLRSPNVYASCCYLCLWQYVVIVICNRPKCKKTSLKRRVRTKWWSQTTKTAKIFRITLDGALQWASLQADSIVDYH